MAKFEIYRINLWIYLSLFIGYAVRAVPLEYDVEDWDRELSYDFDTEQSEVRYDPKLLSEELEDAYARQRGAPCNLSNIIYEHGEQVARNDPCEMCVCMDGEVFCYWRQCSDEVGEGINYGSNEHDDGNELLPPYWKLTRTQAQATKRITTSKHSTMPTKVSKIRKVLRPTKIAWSTNSPPSSTIAPKSTKFPRIKKIHKTKKPTKHPRKPARKRMKSKKVFSFPEHLPATLHYDMESANRNQLAEESVEEKDEKTTANHERITFAPDSSGDDEPRRNVASSTTAAFNDNISSSKAQNPQEGNDESVPQFQSAERNISQNGPNTNRWQGFSLRLSNGTMTPSSSSSSSSSTIQTTSTMASTTHSGNSNNDGSSNMQNKHINFQSGGIIPNDESIDSENDSDDNDDDSTVSGDVSSGSSSISGSDKKAKAEKAADNDSDLESTRIQFVDVPLAKHYIITSSGSVENADILASENVLSQFRNDYSIVNSDSTANNPSKPSSPGASLAPSLPLQSPTKANNTMMDTTVHDEGLAAINPNDAEKPPSSLSLSTAGATMSAESGFRVEVGSFGATAIVTAENSQSDATSIPAYVVGGMVSSDTSISSASQPAASSSSALSASSSAQQQLGDDISLLHYEQPSTEQPARPQQECVVMGTPYKVGDILPQETGNCLQCVCVEGNSSDDPPRVTCSPHNCPPLVLPDLFDTTGY